MIFSDFYLSQLRKNHPVDNGGGRGPLFNQCVTSALFRDGERRSVHAGMPRLCGKKLQVSAINKARRVGSFLLENNALALIKGRPVYVSASPAVSLFL